MVFENSRKKLLILIALVCLFFIPVPADTLWWREASNSGHTVLFLFISLVLYSQVKAIKRISSPVVTCLVVIAIGLTIGVAIEVSQGLLQREMSLVDLSKDLLGILAGLALALLTRQKLRRNRVLLITAALVFLFIGMSSLIQISWHYVQRSKSFPILIAFDESWSTSFMRLNNSELLGDEKVHNSEGAKYQRVKFNIGIYPGVSIIEPEEDWSTYRILRFNVYSSNEENIKLVLRVHDKQHNQSYDDRFNQVYIIRPGLNSIMVNIIQIENAPYGRKMDLTNVAGVEFFLSELATPLILGVSDIIIEM